MRAGTWLLCFGLLLSWASGSWAHPGPRRAALLSDVEMRADTVLLAHLLPEHVSEELKQEATGVSIGSSPRPGTIRRLQRSEVLSALVAHGLPPTAFDIPQSIQIRRQARELTGEEVWAVIRASLSQKPDEKLADLKPENLHFDTSILVPQEGMQLKVTQMAYDPLLGQARFRLSSSSKRALNPFYVTANFGPSGSDAPAGINLRETPEGIAPGMALVEPKRPATLRLHSTNAMSLLRVQPLTAGRLGEVISVRLLRNRTTLRARVVGFGLLDATF